MSPDQTLLDALSRLPRLTFSGSAYRATRVTHDPRLPSTRSGRWAPDDGPAVLYTSLEREGALAEIAFHWGQLAPLPHRPVAVHTLSVQASKALRLIRADLDALGVVESEYAMANYERTQAIGVAVAVLGCDGLVAPNARWSCENLMLFPDNLPTAHKLSLTATETVDWLAWGRQNGLLPH